MRASVARRARSAAVASALAALLAAAPARGGDGFEKFGDVMRYALPVAALTISTAKRDGQGVAMFAASAVPTLGLTYGLKAVVHEERPDGSGDDSFPSGHTSSAFLGASYLHYRYGWKYGLPSYALATLVGASRIEADKHFVHDVLASVAIANLSAYLLTDPENDRVFLWPHCDSRKKSFGIVVRVFF
jgi:membrane-associated phospholipid phosphatase